MIKRYEPSLPDGTRVEFELPDDYILGTDITLFVNGQLVSSLNDTEHPYGYYLDNERKIFTFYVAPFNDERLYIMYEIPDLINITFDNIDWEKKIKIINFIINTNKVEWFIKTKNSIWDVELNKKEWSTKTLCKTFDNIKHSINFEYTKCSI